MVESNIGIFINNSKRVLPALLKGYIEEHIGSGAFENLADLFTRIDKDAQRNKISQWLAEQSISGQLAKASEDAVNCFLDQRLPADMQQWMISLPLDNLPEIQAALLAQNDFLYVDQLEDSIKNAVSSRWESLDANSQEYAAKVFLGCLRRALLKVEKYSLSIIGKTVLRTEEKLEDHDETVRIWMEKLDRKYDTLLTQLPLAPQKIVFTPLTLTDPTILPEPGLLPPGSHLPLPRNEIFTGREKDLLQLAKDLLTSHQGPSLVTQAITGMGGVGKTQLAVEFAFRYGSYFQAVHWLELSDPNLFESELANNGRQMGLVLSEDSAEAAGQTLKAWRELGGPRLVILDNLEDVDKAQDLITLLKDSGDVRLLITARWQAWPVSLVPHQHKLETFTKTESRNFLRQYLIDARKYPVKDLNDLGETLGYLPLALALAAPYVAENRLAISAFLKEVTDLLVHKAFDDWPDSLPNPTKHDKSLRATFEISWKSLEEEDARSVFLRASWAAPNTPIPRVLLTNAAKLDEKALGTALLRLERSNLMQFTKKDSADPTIHPLLAAFGQTAGKEEDWKAWNEAVQAAGNDIFHSGQSINFPALRPHYAQ